MKYPIYIKRPNSITLEEINNRRELEKKTQSSCMFSINLIRQMTEKEILNLLHLNSVEVL